VTRFSLVKLGRAKEGKDTDPAGLAFAEVVDIKGASLFETQKKRRKKDRGVLAA